MMCKVSIVVPIFRIEARYLVPCLISLSLLPKRLYEVLLIVDSLQDTSLDQDEIAPLLRDMKVYRKVNGGLSSARNYGVEKASGEYVVFLDGDDFIDVDRFHNSVQSALSNSVDAAFWGFNKVFDSHEQQFGIVKRDIYVRNQSDIRKILTSSLFIGSAWSGVFKKSLAMKITFTEGILFEDLDWYVRLIPELKSIKVFSAICYNYVQRETSIMRADYDESTKNQIQKTILNWLDFIRHNNSKHEVLDRAIRVSSHFNLRRGQSGMDTRDNIASLKRIIRSTILYRTRLTSLRRLIKGIIFLLRT